MRLFLISLFFSFLLNYAEATNHLNRLRIGGKEIDIFVKAEKLLPLCLLNEQKRLVVDVTNENSTNSLIPIYPHEASERFTWEQAQTVTNSQTFVWKDCKGINSVVQGYYSSNAPVWWALSSVAFGYSNGLYQARCTLIAPRFVFSLGHAPAPQWGNPQPIRYEFVDWNDEVPPESPYTNVVFAQNEGHKSWFYPTNAYNYFRFVGTNNQVYFRRSIARYNYYDVTNKANYAWPETNITASQGGWAINLLEEDLPSDVIPAKLWPTNLADYVTVETGESISWPYISTCQHNWYHLVNGWDGLPTKLVSCNISGYFPASGDSGSPAIDILNNYCIRNWQPNPEQYELLLAAMHHLWTEIAEEPEQTCQFPTLVDLTNFQKLR